MVFFDDITFITAEQRIYFSTYKGKESSCNYNVVEQQKM